MEKIIKYYDLYFTSKKTTFFLIWVIASPIIKEYFIKYWVHDIP